MSASVATNVIILEYLIFEVGTYSVNIWTQHFAMAVAYLCQYANRAQLKTVWENVKTAAA